MQVFQELTIRGTPEQIAATADGICARVAEPWSQNTELERRLIKKVALERAYCFDRVAHSGLRAATLFLVQREPTSIRVTNIVPDDSPELNFSQYNALLTEFTETFVRPVVKETHAHVDLSPADVDIEHWLSPDAANKLRAFSTVANKRTKAAHPTDKKLWFDFIVAAHRTKSLLDSSTLSRWLQEMGGWSEEAADELAVQYERERGVLDHADSMAVGA